MGPKCTGARPARREVVLLEVAEELAAEYAGVFTKVEMKAAAMRMHNAHFELRRVVDESPLLGERALEDVNATLGGGTLAQRRWAAISPMMGRGFSGFTSA